MSILSTLYFQNSGATERVIIEADIFVRPAYHKHITIANDPESDDGLVIAKYTITNGDVVQEVEIPLPTPARLMDGNNAVTDYYTLYGILNAGLPPPLRSIYNTDIMLMINACQEAAEQAGLTVTPPV